MCELLSAVAMQSIAMKYLLRRCEIFLAENEIPYGMKYLPLANIKGLRRKNIKTAERITKAV